MSGVYQPKGRAGEYWPQGVNLYDGCPHGCIYCYAPDVLRVTRKDFHSRANPRPDILDQVTRWAAKHQPQSLLGEEAEPVGLCPLCDPYPMGCDSTLTREVIRILNTHNIPVKILTKTGIESRRDFDLLVKHPGNRFGVTMTAGELQETMESESSRPWLRLAALKAAHHAGIKTWASVEPVYDPEATLEAIEESLESVDHYYLGHWNHTDQLPPKLQTIYRRIDWAEFYHKVKDLLDQTGAKYTVKEDLLWAAGVKGREHGLR